MPAGSRAAGTQTRRHERASAQNRDGGNVVSKTDYVQSVVRHLGRRLSAQGTELSGLQVEFTDHALFL